MSNLQIYKKPELAILEENTKIRQYSEMEFNTKCANLVYNLLNLLGVNDGKEEHHTELVKHIKSVGGHYTLEEIKKAFELYVSHQLGLKVFQQLNAVVFGNVMKAYENYKNEKLRNYRLKLAIPQKTEKSKSEIKEIMNNAALMSFDEFKETKSITGITHHIYNYLDEMGLMPKDKDYKTEVFNKAKKMILSREKANKSVAQNVLQHNRIVEKIESIKNNKSSEAENLSKHMVLQEYFNKLISNNTNLKDLLK